MDSLSLVILMKSLIYITAAGDLRRAKYDEALVASNNHGFDSFLDIKRTDRFAVRPENLQIIQY